MPGFWAFRKMLEWRNWQTHWTQNPAPFIGHEGSTPSSSTSGNTSGIGREGRAQPWSAGPLAALAQRAIYICLVATIPALADETAKTDASPPKAANSTGQPDWLSLGGEFRVRYENRQSLGYRDGSDDGYALVRTRIDIGIEPADWLKFGFQGQDSRAPAIREGVGNIGAFRDGFDVRQAYVRFGGSKSPVAVTVGRQLLAYGDQRLVGALDWANTSRAFDAVKVELRAPTRQDRHLLGLCRAERPVPAHQSVGRGQQPPRHLRGHRERHPRLHARALRPLANDTGGGKRTERSRRP